MVFVPVTIVLMMRKVSEHAQAGQLISTGHAGAATSHAKAYYHTYQGFC